MLDESKIKFLEQSKGLGSCGPVSLQIVLAYFGIEKSENELIDLCGATPEAGTDHGDLEKAVTSLGLQFKTGSWKSAEESWETLNYWVNEKGVPVIVNWFSVFGGNYDGHYSVVYKITKEYVWLANPEFDTIEERNQKISWNNFLQIWFDFDGEYIAKSEDVVARWWLVVLGG